MTLNNLVFQFFLQLMRYPKTHSGLRVACDVYPVFVLLSDFLDCEIVFKFVLHSARTTELQNQQIFTPTLTPERMPVMLIIA